MSGFVGIFSLDGAPVDARLLGRMTAFMAFRGPDAQHIWVDGQVGFGHTLLKTTEEAEHEHQPFTLDGRVWIVADARVDARRELVAALLARDEHPAPGATDVELIARAYNVWGEACVQHLLGDFAFAVWHKSQSRLFCARDHLGVKPFFYARTGNVLAFSNTLDCLRQHPAVSDTLDDLAIADFLLFGFNQELHTTSFADIRRLPPAHVGTWSADAQGMRRYWTLPVDDPLYFRRAGDYTDRFRELLHEAVDDRLRVRKVGVFMSGGLDSTTLAVSAHHALERRGAAFEVHAFTSEFGAADDTRHYAGLVADALGIPIHYREGTDDVWDPEWHRTSIHTPEPTGNPMNLVADRASYRRMSSYARVLFYGEGPDNALRYEWRAYVSFLLRRQQVRRLLADIGSHLVAHRRIPLLSTVPRIVQERWQRHRLQRRFPEWLDAGFVARFELRQRWDLKQAPPASNHPVRPEGHGSFANPLWQHLFETLDSAYFACPVEVRHPFVDLRLLRFLLAVPVLPWCRSKYLMRHATRGLLPEPVRVRAKSILEGDPVWDRVRAAGLPLFEPTRQLRRFVDPARLRSAPSADGDAFWRNFGPRSLDYWLRNLRNLHRPSEGEEIFSTDKGYGVRDTVRGEGAEV